MKIGLFTDSHYCNKNAISNRMTYLSFEKIKKSMAFFKENKVDLVICLGDLVDDCENREANVNEIKRLSKMIRSFGIPFYSLMGNHDCQNFTKEEFDYYTSAYPPFTYDTENSRMIFLDCNYETSGKHYTPGNVEWTNTFLPENQMQELSKALKCNKEIYLFLHQNIDNTICESHLVKNADKIRELIKDSNVKMVIQGHYHSGKESVIDNIKYFTMLAMCEHEENYYKIIEIK